MGAVDHRANVDHMLRRWGNSLWQRAVLDAELVHRHNELASVRAKLIALDKFCGRVEGHISQLSYPDQAVLHRQYRCVEPVPAADLEPVIARVIAIISPDSV